MTSKSECHRDCYVACRKPSQGPWGRQADRSVICAYLTQKCIGFKANIHNKQADIVMKLYIYILYINKQNNLLKTFLFYRNTNICYYLRTQSYPQKAYISKQVTM